MAFFLNLLKVQMFLYSFTQLLMVFVLMSSLYLLLIFSFVFSRLYPKLYIEMEFRMTFSGYVFPLLCSNVKMLRQSLHWYFCNVWNLFFAKLFFTMLIELHLLQLTGFSFGILVFALDFTISCTGYCKLV